MSSEHIAGIVSAFRAEQHKHQRDVDNLVGLIATSPELRPLIHSVRHRVKDPEHLREKLMRKGQQRAERGLPPITMENYKELLPDLAGVRVLHLRMQQMRAIHPALLRILEAEGYLFAEPVEAKTWDPEYQSMFQELQIKTSLDSSMYTSVHYVVRINAVVDRRIELQVRTLAEEVWGEVSHLINYPAQTGSVACQEQLKVLARVVSGCTRLVDSLFASHEEYGNRLTAGSGGIATDVKATGNQTPEQ